MAAAKRELPLGGKRARMGTGRARSERFELRLSPHHIERLNALADAEGVTRTVLLERWIDEHSAPQDASGDVPSS